nr:MAG: internal scaffolding protein [Microvirus sp.]
MKNRMENRKVSVRANGSLRIQSENMEPTMTQQQFKDECDINNILRKHGHDPVAFQALTRPGGMYADFSNITEYRDMLDAVIYAQDAFSSLPAHIRSRFANDPQQLLDFVQDKQNYDEGVKLGLVPKKPTQSIPLASPNDDSNDDKAAKVSKKQNP